MSLKQGHWGEGAALDFSAPPVTGRGRFLRYTEDDVRQDCRVRYSQRRFEGRERPAAPGGTEQGPEDPPQSPQQQALRAFLRRPADITDRQRYGQRDLRLRQHRGDALLQEAALPCRLSVEPFSPLAD